MNETVALLSIDFEEWFCSHNLQAVCPLERWDQLESRIERQTRNLLELLAEANLRATFFVLGWVAERRPELIRVIAGRGHEIGSHGYSHRRLQQQTPAAFREDLVASVKAIEWACGRRPVGYRAPAFSIVPATLWALEILREEGFEYDSSIYPIGAHPDYGWSGAPVRPTVWENGLELYPMSYGATPFLRLPCSGGGYLRQLPYPVFQRLATEAARCRPPYIFYLHPWEIDPGIPRVSPGRLARFRHYRNLDKTSARLRRFLPTMPFTNFAEYRENFPLV